MTWLRRSMIGLSFALVGALVPATAHAVSVDCSDEFGSCTVSNDGFDSVQCECEGGAGGGTTGGNDWDGLNEEELMEVCLGELSLCEPFGTDTFPTTTGVGDTGDTFGTTTMPPGTTDATTGIGDTGATSDSATSTTGDSDGTTTGDSGSTTADSQGTTGGSAGTTGGDSQTASASDSDSASASGDPATDTAASGGSTGGESDSGAASEETDSGCGCTSGADTPSAFGLALLGLFGLRRRRR